MGKDSVLFKGMQGTMEIELILTIGIFMLKVAFRL